MIFAVDRFAGAGIYMAKKSKNFIRITCKFHIKKISYCSEASRIGDEKLIINRQTCQTVFVSVKQ